jgi:dTDP-glucose 4,6-dehydratase
VTIINTLSPRAKFIHEQLKRLFVNWFLDKHLNVVWGSVTDQEILEKTVPDHDALIHLAAWASVDQSLDRPWPPFEVNAIGTYNVLEAARRFGKPNLRIVVASSCEVYGPIVTRVDGVSWPQQDESTPMMPRSPYAATKVAEDRFAYAYAVTYDMDITILRPCNIYGPRQRHGGAGAVIPTFVKNAIEHRPLIITGGGKQSREFMHVDDLAAAYLRVLNGPRSNGDVYNVGTGETRTIEQLAQAIVKDPRLIQWSEARVADVAGFLLDSKKFRDRFDWTPTVKFDDGLQSYINWAQERGGDI